MYLLYKKKIIIFMHNILQTNGGGGAKNGGKFNFGHITYVIEFSDAGGTSKEQADIKKY